MPSSIRAIAIHPIMGRIPFFLYPFFLSKTIKDGGLQLSAIHPGYLIEDSDYYELVLHLNEKFYK
ncbi:hypothetical protein [Scytonema sp. PRP1]|uniref:hypothetical protein n=1 Tax=Scytonema sp. PRP1 TaxID=3120513 RepID=UPI002FD5B299